MLEEFGYLVVHGIGVAGSRHRCDRGRDGRGREPAPRPLRDAALLTSAASGANGSGQAGTVLTTDDSFDKVYAWYKDHMPAGSEKAKLSAGGMSSATFQTTGDGGKQVVAITSQGGKTTISLAKTQ